jgi:hypothetical protein
LKTTLAAAIDFPFESGKEYLLAELKAFEEKLLWARRANGLLSNELRAPEARSWIKLRNEELIPVLHYARHQRMADDTTFMVMPDGCKIDLRLTHASKIENLQITIANPKWDFPEPESIKHSGHQQRLSMEILNRDGCGGWGPITKAEEELIQESRAVSMPMLLDSHRAGLVDALSNKFRKDYGNDEITLLAYASTYSEGLTLEQFRTIVPDALGKATSEAPNKKGWFRSICIFDHGEDYFFEDRDRRNQ